MRAALFLLAVVAALRQDAASKDKELADKHIEPVSKPGNDTVLAPLQEIRAEMGELELVGQYPSPRGGHVLVRTDDHTLFLWGGCDLDSHCDSALYAFDTATEVWSAPHTSGPAPLGRIGHAAWVDGSPSPYLWVFGGSHVSPAAADDDDANRFLGDIHALHLPTMRWSQPRLGGVGPSPRYQMASVAVNQTAWLVLGGADSRRCYGDTHVLDTDRMQWRPLITGGDQPSPRESHTAVLVGYGHDMRVVIYGGYHNEDILDDVYELNMTSLLWRRIDAAGPGLRGGHSTFVVGGRVFVFGGCDEPHGVCPPGLAVTDPAVTTAWSTVANLREMPSPREWAAVSRSRDRVYLFGGCYPARQCFGDMWLLEFEDTLQPLQFVSEEVAKVMHTLPGKPRHDKITILDRSRCNRTNISIVYEPAPPPRSRPGQDMIDKLQEIRRELQMAEDLCSSVSLINKRIKYNNGTFPTVCPPGTRPVRLRDLNLEMFNMLVKNNGTLWPDASKANTAGSTPEAAGSASPSDSQDGNAKPSTMNLMETAEGIGNDANEFLDSLELLEVQSYVFSDNQTANSLVMNTTVCFDMTGPVLVLGNTTFTLQDLYAAMEFNRTLEGSAKRKGWFKPSPSPSPLPYNRTGGYMEEGRWMGRRMDQGKRRSLDEIKARMEKELVARNCTTLEAQKLPECTLPFFNLTRELNATANWTMPPTPEEIAARKAAEAEEAEDPVCAPGDKACAEAQKVIKAAVATVCAPDDHRCLKGKAAALCPPDDEVCKEAVLSGNSTTGVLGEHKKRTFWEKVGDEINDNATVIALSALAILAAFIALGAVLTSLVKEKRKTMKLEESLKTAIMKKEDEVWVKG